jgi:hypothetical protein
LSGNTSKTVTRMYPAVGNFNSWYSKQIEDEIEMTIGTIALRCMSKCIVTLGCEACWPLLYCFITYPMAGMFGNIFTVLTIALFLALNNLCYVAIGSTLGVLFDSISHGMIASTLVSQTSLIAAGFYTELPAAIDLIRYISPVFWAYRGIVKMGLRWSDTYACFKGQSDVGVNQCYLEYSPGIDALKKRGINVATFNDAQSDEVHVEILMLCLLYAIFQVLIFAMCCHKVAVKKKVAVVINLARASIGRLSVRVSRLSIGRFSVGAFKFDNEVLDEPIDLPEDDDDENLSYDNGNSRNLNEIEDGDNNDDMTMKGTMLEDFLPAE